MPFIYEEGADSSSSFSKFHAITVFLSGSIIQYSRTPALRLWGSGSEEIMFDNGFYFPGIKRLILCF